MTEFFDNFLNFDLSVFEWMQSIQNGFTNFFFKYYTMLGEYGLIFVVIGVALLISKKYRKVGFAILGAIAISGVLNKLVLKNIIERPRPFNLDTAQYAWWFKSYVYPDIVSQPDSYSFPSGHAVAGFSSAFAAMVYNRKWGFGIFAAAVVMAFSRVYLEVHYCSDVIASFIVSIFYCLLTVLAVHFLYPLFEKILAILKSKYYETKMKISMRKKAD